MRILCPQKSLALLCVSSLNWLALGCTEEEPPPEAVEARDAGDPGIPCDFDEINDFTRGTNLMVDTPVNGRICPPADEDWYRIRTGSDSRIAVSVRMLADISPVTPAFSLHAKDGTTVASAQERNGQAYGVFCVDPGTYGIKVTDASGARADVRNDYELSVSTGPEPDSLEPNNKVETAVPLTSGTAQTGYIACASDQDWYTFQTDKRLLVTLDFEMEKAAFQPFIQLSNAEGDIILNLSNQGSQRSTTRLSKAFPLEEPGPYFIRITDDDGLDADGEVPYTIKVSFTEDIDPNEPNNLPAEATPITELECGDDWSDWTTFQGTFGTPGDVDWFKVDLSGCERGLIEAELILDTTGLEDEVSRKLQSSISLIRIHPDTECSDDNECNQLNRRCQSGWDCSGFSNQCNDGFCAGFGTCLPENRCGALQIQRRHQENQPNSLKDEDDNPINGVYVSAPILDDDRTIYLRASDFAEDGEAPQSLYRFRVRVRTDPDTNEPNNLYSPNVPMVDNQSPGQQRKFVMDAGNNGRLQPVPVHACGGGAVDPCERELKACERSDDQDGDGLEGYPLDPGCRSPTDDDEATPNPAPACAYRGLQTDPADSGPDKVDQDGDGKAGYPDDPGCLSAADNGELDPECPELPLTRLTMVTDDMVELRGEINDGDSSEMRGACGGNLGREHVYAVRVTYPGTVLTVDLISDDFEGVVYVSPACNPGLAESYPNYCQDPDAQNCRSTELCAPSRSSDAEASPIQERQVLMENAAHAFVVVDTNGSLGNYTLRITLDKPAPKCGGEKDNHGAGGHPAGGQGGDGGSAENGGQANNGGDNASGSLSGGLAIAGGSMSSGGAGLNAGSLAGSTTSGGISTAVSAGMSTSPEDGAGMSMEVPPAMAGLPMPPTSGGDARSGGETTPGSAGQTAGGAPEMSAGVATGGQEMGGSNGEGGVLLSVPPALIPTCCRADDAVWTEGTLSYEYDQDWFLYAHPCPGQNCMLRINFKLERGPIDHQMTVYRADSSAWFDLQRTSEKDMQDAVNNGWLGGIIDPSNPQPDDAQDSCFYAYYKHTGRNNAPYYYALQVRDFLPVADYGTGQKYQFCIEKVGDGCHMPCWAEKEALKPQECEACGPGRRGQITNLDIEGGCDPGPYMSIDDEEALTQEQQEMQLEPCQYECR